MTDKIKILYLAANPLDTGRLRVQEEARDLQERIRQSTRRDDFEFIYFPAVRPRDLLRGLQEVQPHIIHFSGHGNEDKQIVLQDDVGLSCPVAPEDLAGLAELFKANLKVALMTSCYGHTQAEALRRVLDFTIGMDEPISDEGALRFSAAFYQVLASGGSIRQAFESARLLTRIEGHPVFKVSDLLVREGAEANLNEPFVKVLPSKDVPPPSPTRSEETRPSGDLNTVSQHISDSQNFNANAVAGNNNEVSNERRRYWKN
ncbi:MAG: CHAT domain-containing protein [Acidobacteria bacterium]|nr:CHAT domain-containing protein [Acidobacteriota bacterium]